MAWFRDREKALLDWTAMAKVAPGDNLTDDWNAGKSMVMRKIKTHVLYF